jgi:hypothetical protein
VLGLHACIGEARSEARRGRLLLLPRWPCPSRHDAGETPEIEESTARALEAQQAKPPPQQGSPSDPPRAQLFCPSWQSRALSACPEVRMLLFNPSFTGTWQQRRDSPVLVVSCSPRSRWIPRWGAHIAWCRCDPCMQARRITNTYTPIPPSGGAIAAYCHVDSNVLVSWVSSPLPFCLSGSPMLTRAVALVVVWLGLGVEAFLPSVARPTPVPSGKGAHMGMHMSKRLVSWWTWLQRRQDVQLGARPGLFMPWTR